MSPYDTPAGLRQAIEARLREKARGSDHQHLARLRRAVVFERIVRRLDAHEPGEWIPKGGLVLEWRLGNTIARTTKDLDVVVRADSDDAVAIHERLATALAADPDRDHFVFEVAAPERLSADTIGRPGYRFGVEAGLAGRRFERVKLDVVPRADEIYAFEQLRIPQNLSFTGINPPTIPVVSPAQQFAEKLHALTFDYGERTNGRAHDLVDLVLMIEREMIAGPDALAAALHVFTVRATHPLPKQIENPPAAWVTDYEREAGSCGVTAKTLASALEVLRRFWTAALGSEE